MKLIILIPAYNEEKKIGDTIKRIPKKVKGIDKIITLVVNDGSHDNTAKIAQDNGAKVISHSVNKGVGKVFHTGLEYALKKNADLLVNIDADGQFDPQEIPQVIHPIIEEKADMVLSNRFHNGRPENMSNLKYFGNIVMSKLISTITKTELRDVSSGFRAYNREAMLNLNLIAQFTYTQESIINLAFKNLEIIEVPVSIKYFKGRKSRVAGNLFKYGYRTLNIIFRTYRDYKPLRFFGFAGISIFLIGLCIDFIMIIYFLNTGSFSPYIFIILSGIYLNSLGIALIILGIIADMFDRVRLNQEKIIYNQNKLIYKEQ
jgi:glycosyltransferase involved in cell wall biosynthesis